MEKIVIDTNVVIGAFISPNGVSAVAIEKVYSDDGIEIYYNEKMLAEYRKKLTHSKFEKYSFDIKEIENIIAKTRDVGVLVEPTTSDIHIRDEDDRVFYDTAKESGAVLITWDKDLLELNEDFIMKPSEYMNEYRQTIEAQQRENRVRGIGQSRHIDKQKGIGFELEDVE